MADYVIQRGDTLEATTLKGVVSYDPATGLFTRLVALSPRSRIGDVLDRRRPSGYVEFGVLGRTYEAHRLAWLYVYGEWPAAMLDHIDGDRANNRITNLRLCNMSQNIANSKRSKNNTSGSKGVSFNKQKGRYHAYIGKSPRRHLGYFESLEDASVAYMAAATEMYGEFARGA